MALECLLKLTFRFFGLICSLLLWNWYIHYFVIWIFILLISKKDRNKVDQIKELNIMAFILYFYWILLRGNVFVYVWFERWRQGWIYSSFDAKYGGVYMMYIYTYIGNSIWEYVYLSVYVFVMYIYTYISTYVWEYVYMYVYTYVYAYMTHIYTYISYYVWEYVYMYLYKYIYACMTYIYTYISNYEWEYVYLWLYVYMMYIYIRI